MSAELVGPVATVHFTGGPRDTLDRFNYPRVAYSRPRNTIDPRHDACTDHHVACDCREALFAENESEARGDFDAMQKAFEAILAGHDTHGTDDGRPGCLCTGCQIARRAHIYVSNAYHSPVADR